MVIKKEISFTKQDLINLICEKHNIVNNDGVEFQLNMIKDFEVEEFVFDSITVKGKIIEENRFITQQTVYGPLVYGPSIKDIQNPTCVTK